MEIMLEHLGHGLWLSLLLSLPAVLLAAAIGLVVGILQAVTQVQEQTIAAAPKILSVFLLIIFGGQLMMRLMSDYIRESIYTAFSEIPASDVYILPAKPRTVGQQRAASFFRSRFEDLQSDKVKEAFNAPMPSGGGKQSSTFILNGRMPGKAQPGAGEKMFLQKQGAGSR